MRKKPKSIKARQNEEARNRRIGKRYFILSDEQESVSSYRLDLIYIRSAREEEMIYASKKELVKLKAEDKRLYKEEESHLYDLEVVASREEERRQKEINERHWENEHKSDFQSNDAFDW